MNMKVIAAILALNLIMGGFGLWAMVQTYGAWGTFGLCLATAATTWLLSIYTRMS